MKISKHTFAAATLALALGGCVGFGTNVKGDFTCRAPKGTCAPSHVIDERATAELGSHELAGLDAARVRAGIASGDIARTAERTIRIVFPAHVDEAGTLHDEAVAWAVVEKPQWAGEVRRKEQGAPPPLMRQLRNQLKAAQSAVPEVAMPAPGTLPAAPIYGPPADTSDTPAPDDDSPFSLASPLVLPSTVAEAVAGAHAPAVEGFDMSAPPHDRTPRPQIEEGGLKFPSVEAVDAAVRRKASRSAISPKSEQVQALPANGGQK